VRRRADSGAVVEPEELNLGSVTTPTTDSWCTHQKRRHHRCPPVVSLGYHGIARSATFGLPPRPGALRSLATSEQASCSGPATVPDHAYPEDSRNQETFPSNRDAKRPHTTNKLRLARPGTISLTHSNPTKNIDRADQTMPLARSYEGRSASATSSGGPGRVRSRARTTCYSHFGQHWSLPTRS